MIVLFLFICLFGLILGTLYLVSSNFKKNLEKFEQWLSRNRDETMKIGSKNSIYAKYALYSVFLSMLLIGIYPLINQQIVENKLGSATIDIGDDFSVKYEDSPKSVSYTHLDVYKRQVLESEKSFFSKHMNI